MFNVDANTLGNVLLSFRDTCDDSAGSSLTRRARERSDRVESCTGFDGLFGLAGSVRVPELHHLHRDIDDS
jgi:hypothetical protein